MHLDDVVRANPCLIGSPASLSRQPSGALRW
jgi:hypothetical protein